MALSSLIEAARGLAAHDGPVTAPILVWTGSTQFSISAPRRGAQVAQSVEQRTENPCVGGSIPPLGTSVFAVEIKGLEPRPRLIGEFVLCQAPLAKPKEIEAFPAAPSDSMSQNLAQRIEPRNRRDSASARDPSP